MTHDGSAGSSVGVVVEALKKRTDKYQYIYMKKDDRETARTHVLKAFYSFFLVKSSHTALKLLDGHKVRLRRFALSAKIFFKKPDAISMNRCPLFANNYCVAHATATLYTYIAILSTPYSIFCICSRIFSISLF